jgi:vacuolar-type H+-ATPase subunit I/STV1
MPNDSDRKRLTNENRQLAPVDRSRQLVTPPQDPGGALASAVSGFVSKMRTRALEEHAREIRALGDTYQAKAELAESYLNASKAAQKLRDGDNIVAEDQRQRNEHRTQDEHQRWLNDRARKRQRDRAAAEDAIAVALNDAAIERARDQALRAQQVREFTQAIKDLKTERGEHMFTAGALDAEGHRLTAEEILARRRAALGGAPAPPQPVDEVSEAISTLEDELRNLQARGASAAEIGTLYNAIARLKAGREK